MVINCVAFLYKTEFIFNFIIERETMCVVVKFRKRVDILHKQQAVTFCNETFVESKDWCRNIYPRYKPIKYNIIQKIIFWQVDSPLHVR